MSDIKTKIIKAIAEQLNKDPSTVELGHNILEDLGADSLDLVEIVMAVEDACEVSLSDDDANDIKTVGDFVNKVESLLK